MHAVGREIDCRLRGPEKSSALKSHDDIAPSQCRGAQDHPKDIAPEMFVARVWNEAVHLHQ
jgi:hypothetical protein